MKGCGVWFVNVVCCILYYGEFYKQSNVYTNSGYQALLRIREGLEMDYFGTVNDGGVVVGGVGDTDESQACALESMIDNLLLDFEEQAKLSRNGNSMPTETKSWFTVYTKIRGRRGQR